MSEGRGDIVAAADAGRMPALPAVRAGRPLCGFSLMELLVVMAIMAIVVAATIPVVSGLLHGSGVKQAENTIQAYLASGRATALQMRTPVAVVFFTDNNPSLRRPAVGVQLVVQLPNTGVMTGMHFTAISDHPVEYLPEGIDVATLSAFQEGVQASGNPVHRCRAILFDADGQLLVRDSLVGDNPDWNMYGSLGDAALVSSSPGVIVYDARTLSLLGLSPADTDAWILKNGTVMLVNAYTGNLIR